MHIENFIQKFTINICCFLIINSMNEKFKKLNNKEYFLLLAGIFLTLSAYFRAINGDLILDDLLFISHEKLAEYKYLTFYSRSFSIATFALNYKIAGIDPTWFRTTNIFLHIITSLALYYLTRLILMTPVIKDDFIKKNSFFIAAAVCVVFMLHPIHTGVVNYIVQRMALLAAMFSFIGYIFYIKGALNSNKAFIYLPLSALSFLLALFSKENAIMAILLIPLFDYIFISAFDWQKIKHKLLIFLVILSCFIIIAVYKLNAAAIFNELISLYENINQPMRFYGWMGIDIDWTPLQYLLTELRIVSRYILLMVFPVPAFMVFDYSNAYPVSKSLFNPLTTILSLSFLFALIFLALKYLKRLPLVSFGILWFFITISLESFLMLGLDPYFEHRNYMPSFGIFLALIPFFASITSAKVRIKKEFILLPLIIVLFLFTFTRNSAWVSAESLLTDTISKVPQNVRAIINLSSIYTLKKDFQKAESYLNMALKEPLSYSTRFNAHLNLATLYKKTKRYDNAETIIDNYLNDTSLLKETELSALYFLKGELSKNKGNIGDAKLFIEKAYSLNKKNPAFLLSLAQIYLYYNDFKKAKSLLNDCIKIEPNNELAHLFLGDIYMLEDLEKAEWYYSKVFKNQQPISLEQIPRESLFNFGQLKMFKGDTVQAQMLFEKAIQKDPYFYPPYIFLGDIFLSKGELDKSITYSEKALLFKEYFDKNDPNTILIYYNLAEAYHKKGQLNEARKNLLTFISLAKSNNKLEAYVVKAKEKLKSLEALANVSKLSP